MTRLAAVLTVHDAETLLPEVVASIRDHVDEIVVGIDVDHTTDNTRAVAESLGCRVADVHIMRDGERDFAQARNQTWAAAREMLPDVEWFFWIDRDDVLTGGRNGEPPKATLKQLIADAEAQRPGVEEIWLPYLYSRDAQGNDGIQHYRERIIRVSANPVWKSRLHETCWTDNAPLAIWSEGKDGKVDYDGARVWVDHKNRKDTEAGKWDRNFPVLQKMLEEDPNDLRTIREIAEAYFAATQWAQAVEWYDRYLEGTQGNSGTPLEERWLVVVYKAKAERMQGKVLDALRTADRAFNMCPWFADACYELMYNYVAQGHWQKALYWFQLGNERGRPDGIFPTSPTDYEGMPNRFIHEAFAGVGDLPKAIEATEKALRYWPNDGDLLHNRRLYMNLYNRRNVVEAALQNARYLCDANEPLKARAVFDTLPAGAYEDFEKEIAATKAVVDARLAHMDNPAAYRQFYVNEENLVDPVPLVEKNETYARMIWLLRRLQENGCKRILNIGIGSGADSLLFARSGIKVVGIDVDWRRVNQANWAAVRLGLIGTVEQPRYTEQKVPGHPQHSQDCYARRGEDGKPLYEQVEGGDLRLLYSEELTCGMEIHEHVEWTPDCEQCGPVAKLPETSVIGDLHPDLPAQFHVADAEKLPQLIKDLGPYDAVVMAELLEHVRNVDAVIEQAEALAPLVILSTPDGTAPQEPYPSHVRSYSQQELENLFWKRGRIIESHFIVEEPDQIAIEYRPGETTDGRWPVVIYCGPGLEQWTPDQIDREGLGGSETAVVRLARELVAKGMHVIVYAEASGTWDGVWYRHHSRFVPGNPVGVFVAWRNPVLADFDIRAERKYLWLHDVDSGDTLTEERAKKFDGVLILSEWHRRHLSEKYPFVPAEKWMKIGNGIEPSRFLGTEERDPNRFVYISSPDRGLERALAMWPFIRREYPEATLHVYYGWENYDRLGRDPSFKNWVKQMAADSGGVEWHGRYGQAALARELMKSSGLFYPGPHPFEETFCISALEAQAAGCVPVTRDNGALPEVNQYGIVLRNGDATVRDWTAALRQASEFTDEQRADMAAWAATQTWGAVAERFRDFVRASLKEEVAA